MKNEQGLSILIAGDKQSEILYQLLIRTGIAFKKIYRVYYPENIQSFMQRHLIDVVLVDRDIPCSQDRASTQDFLTIAAYLPVILVTASMHKDVALELVRKGIQDFLLKEQMNEVQLEQRIWCSVQRKKLELRSIQNNKNKQQQIIDAVINNAEKERTLLGEELHDNINQILSSAKLYIEMACKDDVLNKALAQHGADIVNKAIEEIRKLSKTLVNSYFQHHSLKDALEELTEMLTETRNIQFKISLNGMDESQLDDGCKLTMYRILQEQLNNIVKHAQASFVEITLAQQNATLFLTVKDNGKGFDTKQKRKGIGFSNIENRVSVYHGQIEIDSTPDNGCTLSIQFPI